MQRVVDGDREVIAGRGLLARDDDVAPHQRRRGDGAGIVVWTEAGFGPGENAGPRHRGVDGHSERIGFASSDAALALGRGELTAAPRIERHAIRIARPAAVPLVLGNERRDLAAAFEARVK